MTRLDDIQARHAAETAAETLARALDFMPLNLYDEIRKPVERDFGDSQADVRWLLDRVAQLEKRLHLAALDRHTYARHPGPFRGCPEPICANERAALDTEQT